MKWAERAVPHLYKEKIMIYAMRFLRLFDKIKGSSEISNVFRYITEDSIFTTSL